MFLGQFQHNLDDKGRLTIPVRFRDLLTVNGAYVMQGFDRNLMVLPSAAFEALSTEVGVMTMTDPTARLLRRLIYATASQVEVDRAGRILLPQFLRQFAGIEVVTVIVGAGKYFELWSPESWAGQNAQIQDAQTNADRFAALNLPFA